jgi:mannose-6-phosphate isomerase-like protein (cupin superfamily)
VTDRLTPEIGLKKLAAATGGEFTELFSHGTLSVEIYRPVEVDRQTRHTRDELYVVISGTGQFVNGGARHPFEPGEVLFVPAGVEHRFEDFTRDFATWVFFYGPEGGEPR